MQQEIKEEIVFKTQLEIISAYRNKIHMDKLTIEEVQNLLDADFQYLQQEHGILQTNRILAATPSKEVQGESLSLEAAYKIIEENTLNCIDDYGNDNYPIISKGRAIEAVEAATAPLLAQIKQLQSELGKAGKETNY